MHIYSWNNEAMYCRSYIISTYRQTRSNCPADINILNKVKTQYYIVRDQITDPSLHRRLVICNAKYRRADKMNHTVRGVK